MNMNVQAIKETINNSTGISLQQLHCLVRQANVEHMLNPEKDFSYHLFECLYRFNKKESIKFLLIGCEDKFFGESKEVVLSLAGKYYIGNIRSKYGNC